MRGGLATAAGVVLFLLGVLFFLQGIGVMGGSGGMNNNTTWVVLGPIIAIVGAVLFVRGRTAKPVE